MEFNGKIFHVNVPDRRFTLLKETEYDPTTNEGISRLPVRWTTDTAFTRLDTQNTFAGIHGPVIAKVIPYGGETIYEHTEGEPVVTVDVTILTNADSTTGITKDGKAVTGWFTPDEDRHRTGTLTFDDTTLAITLRGPRAQVQVVSATPESEIAKGFWDVAIHGNLEDGTIMADTLTIIPQVDPRTVDDPALPRVLVVGDSISMNYHDAAKAGLTGIANYYRVEGNAGPSDRGVTCAELWLGEYTEPGLHWDLIQFNHGLHDLKQTYNKDTEEYGAYQIDLAAYKANLEKEIAILRKTGAVLMWCSTTPVPQSSVWASQDIGRKNGADLIFNDAAMEVMANHPDILINDLNTAVRNADFFEEWYKGTDVHFWNDEQQQAVGKLVAESIKKALSSI